VRRKPTLPRADVGPGSVGYGRKVQHLAPSVDEDRWWLRALLVAGVVGVAGVAAARGIDARLEVAALTAVTAGGFAAQARWPRMPPSVLAAWTFSPAVVLNLRHRGEGTMFLMVVALSFLVLVTPDRRARVVAGVVAVLAPPLVQAISPRTGGGRSG